MKPDDKLVGVHGWLRVLCVLLGIVWPLYMGLQSLVAYQALSQTPAFIQMNARESLLWHICVALDVLIIAWSAASGLSLYLKARWAVAFVTVFLFSYPALCYLTNMLFSATTHAAPDYISGLRSLVPSAVWLGYLHTSVRVENTFRRA